MRHRENRLVFTVMLLHVAAYRYRRKPAQRPFSAMGYAEVQIFPFRKKRLACIVQRDVQPSFGVIVSGSCGLKPMQPEHRSSKRLPTFRIDLCGLHPPLPRLGNHPIEAGKEPHIFKRDRTCRIDRRAAFTHSASSARLSGKHRRRRRHTIRPPASTYLFEWRGCRVGQPRTAP